VADGEVWDKDEEVIGECRATDLAFVQSGPGDQQCHDNSFARACRQLESVAEKIASFGHFLAGLDFVEVDDRFDGLLLAKEKTLADRFPLFVAFEPPFQEPSRYQGCARIPFAAPLPYVSAELVNEVIGFATRR